LKIKELSIYSGNERQKKRRKKKKAAALPFFHRLRPPDEYHKIGHSNQQAAKPGRT